MGFELTDHTAEVGIEASAPSLDATFASIASGLAAAMCDTYPSDVGERFDVSVSSESLEALLFDYLDELIYQRDVHGVLPVDHEVTIDAENWMLDGSFRGVPFAHVTARDVKAVTYADMTVEETPAGWRAHVVLDV